MQGWCVEFLGGGKYSVDSLLFNSNKDEMKKLLLSGMMVAASFTCMAQSLEKMQWFNEPEQWKIENNSLSMDVTPQTDYWRISHYGFTVDDAPFLYTLRGGNLK